MNASKTEAPCPCSGNPDNTSLARCCGRFLDQGELPPDAMSLMRSRYTAFVFDRRDYLLATWHPSTRPSVIEAPARGLKWLGLEVRAEVQTGPDAAIVEFVARSRLAGRAHRLHERSRFVRQGGRWLYVDGEILA